MVEICRKLVIGNGVNIKNIEVKIKGKV